MTESRLTAKIVAELRRRKIWHVKIHGGPHQRAGLPDLLLIVEGRAVWIEVKGDGGIVSPLQQHTLEQLRAAGCVAEVVRSFDDFLKLTS
jgi:hypothetical protein